MSRILLGKHSAWHDYMEKHELPKHHVSAAATLVDDVSSGAIRSISQHPGVSVHMSMNYYSPTPGGQDCEVDSRVTKAGRTLAFAEVPPPLSCAACRVTLHNPLQ